ncbi:hypothetical protein [Mycoplasmopsis fermentans]|uniref:hypothetical protein n=1 Tax=Mycoplasmopsis fermentans TaxID=2115 RepID=UPI000F02B0D4|nr:hypothetical protein [Mycoplasmopsis fermentans]RMX35998.1 hypothetical protein MFI1_0234 [Mycoplasmopsis fermentans MF-I1]
MAKAVYFSDLNLIKVKFPNNINKDLITRVAHKLDDICEEMCNQKSEISFYVEKTFPFGQKMLAIVDDTLAYDFNIILKPKKTINLESADFNKYILEKLQKHICPLGFSTKIVENSKSFNLKFTDFKNFSIDIALYSENKNNERFVLVRSKDKANKIVYNWAKVYDYEYTGDKVAEIKKYDRIWKETKELFLKKSEKNPDIDNFSHKTAFNLAVDAVYSVFKKYNNF